MDSAILKLEHDISTFIGTDNGCTVHFEYLSRSLETEHTVSAYTVNPKSGETFLLKSANALTKELALKQILEYVKNQKGLSSFTVKWYKKGTDALTVQTSYFFCHDILDVVEKFFAGKNPEDYIVYEIKLNPMA